MLRFSAIIEIIGVNPYVMPPAAVLQELFGQAGRDKGPIPVHGTLDGVAFTQTLVRFSGAWRLYLNTPMRKATGKETGDRVEVEICYDPTDRTFPVHPKLQAALEENPEAKAAFDQLSPSRQKEIVRYITSLKSEAAVDKNVARAIGFLNGGGRFVGRQKP